jgi:hypothetical protein
LRSQNQPHHLPPSYISNQGEAVALLSFCTSRVCIRWIYEEALAFFMPLSFFSFSPPKKRKAETPGDSFQRPGISLLSKGADPSGVFNRRHSLSL